MATAKQEKVRFDARLPKELKLLFEKASIYGGYKNLTEFIITTLRKRSEEIIKEREEVLASEKDNEIFFNALLNPQKPNKVLKEAFEEYNANLK